MSLPAQTWVHEHTSPNLSTWAYQPKHEYMSIWAQTWLHGHTSPNKSTWAYQPKHDYMSIPARTWVHEYIHEYMSISAQTWVHEHISPNMSTWAYQPMQLYEGTLAIFYMWAHWPIHRIHEIVGNSKDVSILYEITGDWWQRYYMILHIYWLQQHKHGYNWVHAY